MLAKAGVGKVSASPLRALVVELESGQRPAIGSAQQPDAAVAGRGAELQDPLRSGNLDQEVEQLSFVRVDDRDVLLMRLFLHSGEDGVAFRNQAVEVFLKLVADFNCSHGVSFKNSSSKGCRVTT